MASTFNAFEFLKASGELPSNPKKNKKKSKTKGQAKPDAEQNGRSSPAVPDAVSRVVPETTPDVDEGQQLERLAKQSESGASRAKQWKDWIAQALDEEKGADFKKTLLRTRALELTLESCLKAPLTSQQETLLHQLLVTFLPVGDGLITQLLSAGLLQLSALDLDSAPDVKSSALHSIHQLIAWLKNKAPASSTDAPSDVDSWLARINDIDKSLLQKQGSLKIIGPTVGKEHVLCAWHMLKLQEQKVDLLRPGAIPSGTASPAAPAAVVACFKNLREAIGSHLQHDRHANGGPDAFVLERQQMLGAYQREEAVLKQQASQLNSQIKQLESQLKLLRSEAAEVAEKLTQVQKFQSSTFSAAPGSRPHAQELGLPLASAHAALEAAESLSTLVDGTASGGAEQQLLAMQQAQGSAPVDYIGLARSYLAMNLALLSDLPQKVDFCKQRIARAEKMMALSGSSSKILETNRKQKEESEKLMEDTLKWAADSVEATKEVVKNLNARYPILLAVSPNQKDVLGAELRGIDELASRIQQQYSLVTQAVHSDGTPPVPVPAPAAAVASVNPLSQFGLGSGLGTAVPAPAAPVAPVAKPEPPAVSAPGPAKLAQQAPGKPQSNGAPVARPVSTRSWAKVELAPSPAAPGDEALPTPAEALRAEAAEGIRQGGRRRRV